VLKEAGLIDLAATKEVKGGALKYYAAKRRYIHLKYQEI